MNYCICGCREKINSHDKRGRPVKYKYGHNRRGLPSNIKPNSKSKSTGRYRAKKLVEIKECELFWSGSCKGRLEVHHKDKNPLNNNIENLSVLCCSHHRAIDKGLITYLNPIFPNFYTDRSGKRRYV